MICPPPGSLEVPFLKKQYPHLRSLELADDDTADVTTGASDDIEVLIGSDYYWAVVENKVTKGKEGPTAVKSLFGWFLSGPMDTAEPTGKPGESYNLLITENDSLSQSVGRLSD